MDGLSQYYVGTLIDLNLMVGATRPWIGYTKEYGMPLAEQVNASIDPDRFWSVIDSDNVRLEDLDALAAFCACRLSQSVDECRMLSVVAEKLNAGLLASYLDRLSATAPPLGARENEAHEFQVALRMLTGWSRGDDTAMLIEASVSLLALLACRDDLSQSPYGGVAVPPEVLNDYPINLASFRARVATWRSMSIADFFADLVMWCLNTHLRVALRKLRHTGRSTFHMRPSERGLEVVGEIPPPSNTTPRFRQAVQILRDIGALTRDLSKPNRQTRLSDVGAGLLEESSI